MSQNSNHVPVALDDWRGWITARAQELKRDYPSRSKKDCWRAAHSEWHDLRRQQKQATREALLRRFFYGDTAGKLRRRRSRAGH